MVQGRAEGFRLDKGPNSGATRPKPGYKPQLKQRPTNPRLWELWYMIRGMFKNKFEDKFSWAYSFLRAMQDLYH